MKKAEIEKRVEELVTPIIDELGYELWDVEYVKEGSDYFLRVYADKEGGFTVDDCEAVSRRLDVLLDEEDFIEGAYIFEVSSPGLTRKLKKDRDFERSIGRLVDISLYNPLQGEKSFTGVLKSFSSESIIVTDGDTEKNIEIPRNAVSSAKLAFEE